MTNPNSTGSIYFEKNLRHKVNLATDMQKREVEGKLSRRIKKSRENKKRGQSHRLVKRNSCHNAEFLKREGRRNFQALQDPDGSERREEIRRKLNRAKKEMKEEVQRKERDTETFPKREVKCAHVTLRGKRRGRDGERKEERIKLISLSTSTDYIHKYKLERRAEDEKC